MIFCLVWFVQVRDRRLQRFGQVVCSSILNWTSRHSLTYNTRIWYCFNATELDIFSVPFQKELGGNHRAEGGAENQDDSGTVILKAFINWHCSLVGKSKRLMYCCLNT